AGKFKFGGGSFYDGSIYGIDLASYLRPNDKLGVDLAWEWNKVDVPFANGEFTTSIFGARINYSFNPNLYAKAFIQWNHFDRRIISNFLINFIHSPGSDFYLVYNEEWNTSGSIETADRTLVAKFTYLLNL
ncbi:MAG: hypothetical protein ACE5NG_10960, partial [bacterium]